MVERVAGRRLQVAPLGRPPAAQAVGAAGGARVVAVADGQGRVAQPGRGGQRPQGLAAGGVVAVDQDHPGVAAARRPARPAPARAARGS